MELLLDDKVNAKNILRDGPLALKAAIDCGHLDMVKLLLGKKVDVNTRLSQGSA